MPTLETLAAIDFDAPATTATPKASKNAKPASTNATPPAAKSGKLRRVELIQLSAQLSTMLDTGVTIIDALRCVASQADKPGFKFVVEDVAACVERGEDLSTALAKHPKSFPRVYTALVKASEKGGMLGKMIDRATGYLKDEAEIVRKVKGALTYPGIMFAFACTTSLFMLIFVLPRFTGMYAGKEHLLPTPTKILLAASDAVTGHWKILLPATLATVGGLMFWLRTPGGRSAWHAVQLRLPLMGAMYRKLHLSRGLRTIGTLAASGISIIDCLDAARDLAGNERYAALWDHSKECVRAGQPFSESLRNTPLVPPSVVQMLHSGEAGGRLARVTERVAEHAEAELKETITELTRYIEPAMIVGMGVIIGGMTLAMLLPVFTASKVMSQ